MKPVWVDRDTINKIVSIFANEQYPGQEKLHDQHPDVIKFFAPPPALTAADVIQLEFLGTDFGTMIYEALFELYQLRPGPPATRVDFNAILEDKIS